MDTLDDFLRSHVWNSIIKKELQNRYDVTLRQLLTPLHERPKPYSDELLRGKLEELRFMLSNWQQTLEESAANLRLNQEGI
jgi:hypothetical protein